MPDQPDQPDQPGTGAALPPGLPPRSAVRTGVVNETVMASLDALASRRGVVVDSLTVLDIGGGTGGLAVQLAQRGHRVTVVDPSPDSLAALDRRAAETATTARVTGLQGDAAGIAELIPAGSTDLVLCHSVLELVDDPVDALRQIATVLTADGLISLLVANRVAAVVARVSAGRLAEAARMLADPVGRAGDGDPLIRRFVAPDLERLAAAAGLDVEEVHGVRTFADSVPATLLDDTATASALLNLERAAARNRDFIPVASRLHAVLRRSTR